MKPDILWKKKGGLWISPHIFKDWLIRVPTVKHRLSRSGTVALKISERYDLKHKMGILLIDSTAKSYVFIPKGIIDQYEPQLKDYTGVKNSLIVYPVKQMIQDHNLPIVKIPNEAEGIEPERTGLANDIRRKFGL